MTSYPVISLYLFSIGQPNDQAKWSLLWGISASGGNTPTPASFTWYFMIHDHNLNSLWISYITMFTIKNKYRYSTFSHKSPPLTSIQAPLMYRALKCWHVTFNETLHSSLPVRGEEGCRLGNVLRIPEVAQRPSCQLLCQRNFPWLLGSVLVGQRYLHLDHHFQLGKNLI